MKLSKEELKNNINRFKIDDIYKNLVLRVIEGKETKENLIRIIIHQPICYTKENNKTNSLKPEYLEFIQFIKDNL